MKTRNMNFRRLICALVILGLSATTQAQQDREPDAAELQKQLREARMEMAEAARRMARLQREMGKHQGKMEAMHLRFSNGDNGDLTTLLEGMDELRIGELALEDMPPRLGVLLGGPGTDQANEIVGLTPGGGAEAAGLQRGDLLVSVNGRAVGTDQPDEVREILAEVEAGATVPVVVERDGEQLNFEVETSSALRDVRVMVRRMAPDGDGHEREIIIRGPDALPPIPPMPPLAPRFSGLGRDSDLISNHAGLEPYFGTADGVVVLRIDPDNAFNLRDGDVVLSLDNETVQRPVELGRLLLGHAPGDQVVIEVMRQGVLTQLQATVPERSNPLAGIHRIKLRTVPEPPEAPEPPEPPGRPQSL
ncbi:MAG: PDZ domain-containing protein [Wenzhouxiangellaceae bacterium]